MTLQATDQARPAGRMLNIAIAIVGLFCVVRAYAFVATYAANVPFSDQWDLLNPLFDGQSIAGWFLYQHGPHRQGVGGVLTYCVGQLTHFDGRAEAMLCLAGLVLALVCALALRRRLNGQLGWIDLVWPIVFLSARQGHHLAVVPNNAHSTTPLLLVMILALLLTLARNWWRDALLVVIGIAATFTGFGVFVAPLVPLFFFAEAFTVWRSGDRRTGLSLIACGAASVVGNAAFLVGYHADTSNPQFGIAGPGAYLSFVADLFALSFSSVTSPIGQLIGGATALAIVLALIVAGIQLLKKRRLTNEGEPARPFPSDAIAPRVKAIFFLSGFTLLFAMFCAVGRATLPSHPGSEPRYFALLIPGLIALSLQVDQCPRRIIRIALSGLMVAVLLCGHAVSTQRELDAQAQYRELKEAWRFEYLRTGDAAETYERFSFDIYTSPPTDFDKLDRKARFLRDHQLNLYRAD